MRIAIINGPNINLLGIREVNIYGHKSFVTMNKEWENYCYDRRITLLRCQSNSEGELINFVHSIVSKIDGLIINAGAFSHTSLALADALRCIKVPKIEVHISNIYRREKFRQQSFLSPICDGKISGMGSDGYLMALSYLYKTHRNRIR